MSELVEYFVHHYTLVMDNDQGTQNACLRATRDALGEQGATLAGYVGMTDEERRTSYASAVGANILALIEEWTDEVLDEHEGSVGVALIRDVLITNGSDIAYELGAHYLPDSDDASDFLDEDDEPDDDQDDQDDDDPNANHDA